MTNIELIQQEAEKKYSSNEYGYSAKHGFIEGANFGLSLKNGWVPVSERLPTKEDADEYEHVEVWDINDPVAPHTRRIHISVILRSKTTHWRKITPPKTDL